MKIQIVNCLPLEYPYQVTKMKKLMTGFQIDYIVMNMGKLEPSDLYIIIAGKMNDQTGQFICEIEKSKTVLIVSEQVKGYHCWCVPKGFEKGFDSEKLMMILANIVKTCPKADLFQSFELKLCRLHKDSELRISPDSLIKGYSEIHLFVKDKVRRNVQIETNRKDLMIYQHWIKGLESEIELLAVKRKS